ncbi:hypothetical protein [Aliivibrio fischeri]|uniref:hypothetical protein n=1 Tax=Aliivibrio fischeri TaxID=668 RepID=UPI00080D92C4|nr:hypothetical protein [Aliivibrio fischeri]OCH04925.1 hypothetical protein A6E11_18785 [Aliivibrio fischeri]OCH11430.1 hypothetical protein A6E09_18955 [Aliivibrio fischeri]
MDLFVDKLLPALLGLLAGIVGTLIAPWVNWRIEKKRFKQQSRKELIDNARKFLASKEWVQTEFNSTVTYSEIRPHLSQGTINMIEKGELIIRRGRGGNVIHSAVLDDLARKEKEWGIR